MSITTPKAGETIIGGTSDYLIEYTAQIAGKQKKFEFSSDQGSTWTIITGTDSTSVYTWSQVPNIATSKGLIRISDELGVFAVSGLFTIIKKVGPSISQVSVNGVAGLHIASGISTTITWLSSGNLGHYLAAEYSPDNSHWTIIDSMITTSENSIPWITPAPSPAMYVRVRSIDSMTISGTYGPFAIDLIAGVRVDENLTVNAISNYPNPVSNTTTFSYYMVKSGPIRLCVYDLIGREVACIVDTKMKDPGLYTADFNASKLVNGSYTYVLTTGSNTVSGTMVVFK
jgi:hypothetical protein